MEGSLRKLVTRNSWSDRIDVEDETVDSVIWVLGKGEWTTRSGVFVETPCCRERMGGSGNHGIIVENSGCVQVQNDGK